MAMQKPRVAPEKRPSVMSATLSPCPDRKARAVVASISRIRAAARTLIADDQNLAFLVLLLRHGFEAEFSESKQRAGPEKVRFFMPATFTMAPSGARLP